jgi:hypothetical protein
MLKLETSTKKLHYANFSEPNAKLLHLSDWESGSRETITYP